LFKKEKNANIIAVLKLIRRKIAASHWVGMAKNVLYPTTKKILVEANTPIFLPKTTFLLIIFTRLENKINSLQKRQTDDTCG
jgi:hypothetical protein